MEPVVKIATRLGVSDVAAAKACRKHNIPLPGRGYWAQSPQANESARDPCRLVQNKMTNTSHSPRQNHEKCQRVLQARSKYRFLLQRETFIQSRRSLMPN